MTTPPDKGRVVITDAATFERWWQRRDIPDDRRLVRDAEGAGLIHRGGGLLYLSPAGHALRRQGEVLRGVVPRRRA